MSFGSPLSESVFYTCEGSVSGQSPGHPSAAKVNHFFVRTSFEVSFGCDRFPMLF